MEKEIPIHVTSVYLRDIIIAGNYSPIKTPKYDNFCQEIKTINGKDFVEIADYIISSA